MLLFDAVELLGDFGERFVPGDALPFARASFGVHAAQRIEHARGIVEVLGRREALGAQQVVVVSVAFFEAQDLVVFDERFHAAVRTVVAHDAMAVTEFFAAFLGSEREGRQGERSR